MEIEICICKVGQKGSPSGGLEPPTFRLTVERASQLRHEGIVFLFSFIIIINNHENELREKALKNTRSKRPF